MTSCLHRICRAGIRTSSKLAALACWMDLRSAVHSAPSAFAAARLIFPCTRPWTMAADGLVKPSDHLPFVAGFQVPQLVNRGRAGPERLPHRESFRHLAAAGAANGDLRRQAPAEEDQAHGRRPCGGGTAHGRGDSAALAQRTGSGLPAHGASQGPFGHGLPAGAQAGHLGVPHAPLRAQTSLHRPAVADSLRAL